MYGLWFLVFGFMLQGLFIRVFELFALLDLLVQKLEIMGLPHMFIFQFYCIIVLCFNQPIL